MIEDKDVTKALENRFDGDDKFNIVQELLELEAENERLKKVMHDNLITDCKGCPYDDALKSWTARIAELEKELAWVKIDKDGENLPADPDKEVLWLEPSGHMEVYNSEMFAKREVTHYLIIPSPEAGESEVTE